MTATAIALPLRQQTPEWVDARRDFIGSSDISVNGGVNVQYVPTASAANPFRVMGKS